MDRRAFLGTLGLLAVPRPVESLAAEKVWRLGVLSGAFPDRDECLDALKQGLKELGYVEGQTHTLEPRWTEGRNEPFTRFAIDLVRTKVDLIVAQTIEAVTAAKVATSTIPIVMASSSYPVEMGLVASLARPGGNITGVANFTPDLMAKRVQLLREAVPTASRIAVLRTEGRSQDLYVRDMESAARRLGAQLQVIETRRRDDLATAFESAMRGGAQAVMSTQGPFFRFYRAQLAELALRHRLPSLSGERLSAEAGTLLSYGPTVIRGCQRVATHVDKILRGAKPADLPIEQPTKFELAINLKTAKALGLTIPPSLLQRADQVIE